MLTLEAAPGRPPRLLLAVGNPGRGDDALGPRLAERLSACGLPGVETLTDFQLQVEHSLDLDGRCEVVFADAAASGEAPCALRLLEARRDASVTSHAMSPAALLDAYARLYGRPAPSAWVLAIRGYDFTLGQPLSPGACANLEAALALLEARWRAAVPARRAP